MSCPSDRLEALVFGELTREEADPVAAHAASCGACAREIEALRAERSAVRRWAAEEPPLAPLDLSRLRPPAPSPPVPLVSRRRTAAAASMLALVAAAAGWLLWPPASPAVTDHEPAAAEGDLACREPPAAWKPLARAIEKLETCYAACMEPEPQGPLACVDTTAVVTSDAAPTLHLRSCE
jgi:anti-sigma factor RsiW